MQPDDRFRLFARTELMELRTFLIDRPEEPLNHSIAPGGVAKGMLLLDSPVASAAEIIPSEEDQAVD